MSLVLGVNLARMLYLVNDTRVTSTSKSGLQMIQDDLIKCFVINKRIASVAAGSLALAVYVLEWLKGQVGADAYLSDLENAVDTHLDQFAKDYVNTTGRVGESIGLVFAGFNSGSGKQIESSRLGNVMSAVLVKSGDGSRMKQSVDPAISNALVKAIATKGTVGKGDLITIDVPSSGLLQVRLAIDRHDYRIEKASVPCYEYAIYHPDQPLRSVKVPDDLLSALEFRDAVKHEFPTAGGHVMTWLITPEASAFPYW